MSGSDEHHDVGVGRREHHRDRGQAEQQPGGPVGPGGGPGARHQAPDQPVGAVISTPWS